MELAELQRETRSSIELERTAKGDNGRDERGRFVAGNRHPNWKGHDAGNGVRYRAHTVIPDLPICADCGLRPGHDRHHIDGDIYNSDRSNLVVVCRGCHNRRHGIIPPRPDGRVVSERMRGRIPWNKGLSKTVALNLRGGRHGTVGGS